METDFRTHKLLAAFVCSTVLVLCGVTDSPGQVAQDTGKKYCSNWSAWHDSQPTKKPTLHVKGTCTFPTTGFSAKLQPHVPPGFNPQIYILDLVVRLPVDRTAKHVVTVPVKYSEQTEKLYTEVQILPDDVTVPVKETSAATDRASASGDGGETINGCIYSIQDCTVLVTKDGKYYHLSGPPDRVATAKAAKTMIRVTPKPGAWEEGSSSCKSEDVTPILIESITVTKMRCAATAPSK
jgi:hypothetical protein